MAAVITWSRRVATVLALLLVIVGLSSTVTAAGALFGCSNDPPDPSVPVSGFAGVFMPLEPPETDPDSLWLTTGIGGIRSFNWDAGCTPDQTIGTGTDLRITNMEVGAALTMTAATDAIQRWAFDPSWVTDYLWQFTHDASQVLQTSAWFPLVGVGLLVCVIVLLTRARHGDVRGVTNGSVWAGLVLMIMSVLLVAPLYLAQTGQEIAGTVISDLQGSTDPTTGETEQIMDSIHYQSWLRRSFGSADSPAAKQYGKAIFDATSYTYAERDLAAKSPLIAQALQDQHHKDFSAAASKVCDADAQACDWLHGHQTRMGLGFLELAFSAVANGFRLVVALLVALCVLILVVRALCWIVAAPYVVTPRGQALGIEMMKGSLTAVGHVIMAAFGSWGFGLWAKVALEPGTSAWLSLILLAIGTFIFWGLIRPDRKLLSMATMGRVNGAGKTAGWILNKLASYVVTKEAVKEANEETAERAAAVAAEAQSAPPPSAPPPQAVRLPGDAHVHEGTVVYERLTVTSTAAPAPVSAVDVYRPPPPPPPGNTYPTPPPPNLIIMEKDAEGVYRPSPDKGATR